MNSKMTAAQSWGTIQSANLRGEKLRSIPDGGPFYALNPEFNNYESDALGSDIRPPSVWMSIESAVILNLVSRTVYPHVADPWVLPGNEFDYGGGYIEYDLPIPYNEIPPLPDMEDLEESDGEFNSPNNFQNCPSMGEFIFDMEDSGEEEISPLGPPTEKEVIMNDLNFDQHHPRYNSVYFDHNKVHLAYLDLARLGRIR